MASRRFPHLIPRAKAMTMAVVVDLRHLQPLPVERFADYEPLVVRVRSTGTIEVRSVTYSVPSRLGLIQSVS